MGTNMTAVLLCGAVALSGQSVYKDIPREYLKEAESVPEFWGGSVDEVHRFLNERVRKGTVSQYGATAGGRPMRCHASPILISLPMAHAASSISGN